jgi:hypothetical protein
LLAWRLPAGQALVGQADVYVGRSRLFLIISATMSQ